jgi:hypothetical protein
VEVLLHQQQAQHIGIVLPHVRVWRHHGLHSTSAVGYLVLPCFKAYCSLGDAVMYAASSALHKLCRPSG